MVYIAMNTYVGMGGGGGGSFLSSDKIVNPISVILSLNAIRMYFLWNYNIAHTDK